MTFALNEAEMLAVYTVGLAAEKIIAESGNSFAEFAKQIGLPSDFPEARYQTLYCMFGCAMGQIGEQLHAFLEDPGGEKIMTRQVEKFAYDRLCQDVELYKSTGGEAIDTTVLEEAEKVIAEFKEEYGC